MKHRRKKKRELEEVPVSSFSDIAFLLIIFFILATTLTQQVGFLTDLPAGEQAQEQSEEATTIRINGETVVFGDRPVDLDQLREELAAMQLAQKEGDAKVVLLEAEGAVKYQTYYDVMASISAAGGVIGIVREEEAEE